MASVHVLKKTENEVVLKCYITENGGVINIPLNGEYIKLDNETFVQNQSLVTIREIFWGAKKDKQIDITRVANSAANTVHGHYYLLNAGSYDFDGFVDNTYANSEIRIIGDGQFHVILKLGKQGYIKS